MLHWTPSYSAKRTRRQFAQWLPTAQEGDRFIYYRGYLAKERGHYYQLHSLGYHVLEASRKGDVALVQRRHGHNDYTYEAIRIHG